jgi:NAD(P)-dependent dehydrogenase (short-subunit alcohol dehydrogenase family)
MFVAQALEKLFSLEGKVILITGSSGGIGSALSKGFAYAGADIALCDLDNERTEALAGEIHKRAGKAKAYTLDVADMESIKTCVANVISDYRRIDVLVNCAGINKREGFLDVSEETYDRLMGVNLKGLYFISQEAAKHMYKAGTGNIINIASFNSTSMTGGNSVYGATKSAVWGLTRSMAMEWAAYGIRANALAPGHILTPLTTVTWEHPTRASYLRERIAMGRPGTPEELVGVAVMLASDSSSYITGALINVDGGATAGGKPWEFDTEYK